MGWVIGGGVLVVVLILVLSVGSLFNGLVRARHASRTSFAQIDTQLTRRHDLIPNLVETAKGYMAHERGTLTAVTEARSAAVTAQRGAGGAAGDPGALMALAGAENLLTQALGQLFALAEA